MKRVLVLGGTGFLGRHVCAALQRAGVSVTVLTRRWAHARPIRHMPLVHVIEDDVHSPQALAKHLPGHDAVINLIAVLHGNEARFEHVHVKLPTRLIDAMVSTGVKRLIHVSALGASLQAPSRYQRSKAQGEQVLVSGAQAHGLQLTLIRPSVIFGLDDRFINLFARLQAFAPLVPLARPTKPWGLTSSRWPIWFEWRDAGRVIRAGYCPCPCPWPGCKPWPWSACLASP